MSEERIYEAPETTEEVVAEEVCMDWSGYGKSMLSVFGNWRYSLSITEMDDTSITGHLEVSYLYEVAHDTTFAGEGTIEGDTVRYHIIFDTLIDEKYFVFDDLNGDYTEIDLYYDKNTDEFSFKNTYYNVVMTNDLTQEKNSDLLAENRKWKGEGEDSLCALSPAGHLFEVDIEKMTETKVNGTLKVFNGETLEHESTFAGRGYNEEGIVYFEVKLDTPRTEEFFLVHTEEKFVMTYNCETEELTVSSYYSFTGQPVK